MSFDDLFIKDKCRLVLILSDASQNALPFLDHALRSSVQCVITAGSCSKSHAVCRSSLNSAILLTTATPASFFQTTSLNNVRLIDWAGFVPGYASWTNPIDEVTKVLSTCLLPCLFTSGLPIHTHGGLFR